MDSAALYWIAMSPPDEPPPDLAAVRAALASQIDDDAHDRSLIRERLEWTPAERLDANTSFLRFYLSIRPGGPLVPEPA